MVIPAIAGSFIPMANVLLWGGPTPQTAHVKPIRFGPRLGGGIVDTIRLPYGIVRFAAHPKRNCVSLVGQSDGWMVGGRNDRRLREKQVMKRLGRRNNQVRLSIKLN
ncbi:MAG: hypothetical protein ACKER6_00205 [Candidatus Hodgkinia cicadicola]